MAQSSQHGPFEDDRTASAASTWAKEDRPAGRMRAFNEADLFNACEAAGVRLGAYDRGVLRWLAGFEPAACAVVAGLIVRAKKNDGASCE